MPRARAYVRVGARPRAPARSRPRYGSRPDVGSALGDEAAAMSLLDRLLVAVVLISALWWACSRHRRPAALQRLSAVAPALAAATVIFDGGPRWQLVPWQALAVGVGARRRAAPVASGPFAPGGAGRSAAARSAVGVVLGALALSTAFVPAAAHALGLAPSRQPDLPLDRPLAAGDADARPGRSPAGHRPGLVPDRHRQRPPGPLLRGPGPAARLDRRAAVVHVRRLRRDRHPRDVRRADQRGAARVAGPGLLAGPRGPARAVHVAVHRAGQPRLSWSSR